jgi:hypothetical protein
MRAVMLVVFLCAAAVAGSGVVMADSDDPAYFESPRQAVEEITAMLVARDWPALARYYDLEGSGIDRAQLVSGEFFWRTKRPEMSHPAFWRYKHPFSPGFHYAWSGSWDEIANIMAPPGADKPEGDPSVVKVVLEVEIEQGSASPDQRGISEFRMRKSERGYQILPD